MSQSYILRPFEPTDAEYEAIVRVYNQSNSLYPGSVDTWRHWDQHRDPIRQFRRYVVEHHGEIGGYGFSRRTDVEENKYRFAIYFLKEWQTAESIDMFYRYLIEKCLENTPTGLLCQTREDEPEKIGWLKQEGFELAMRYPTSTLDVTEFDLSAFAGINEKIASQGLEIASLRELADRDPDWQRKAYDLEMLLSRDVPQPTVFTPPPFDNYAKSEFGDPDFTPDLWLIALDKDAYVGMTTLFKLGDGIKKLESGLTGVHHDYRRRGLAFALKCQNIQTAKRLGARQIVTTNEENNPMYQLNLRLGFRPQPADVDWEKTIFSVAGDIEGVQGLIN